MDSSIQRKVLYLGVSLSFPSLFQTLPARLLSTSETLRLRDSLALGILFPPSQSCLSLCLILDSFVPLALALTQLKETLKIFEMV